VYREPDDIHIQYGICTKHPPKLISVMAFDKTIELLKAAGFNLIVSQIDDPVPTVEEVKEALTLKRHPVELIYEYYEIEEAKNLSRVFSTYVYTPIVDESGNPYNLYHSNQPLYERGRSRFHIHYEVYNYYDYQTIIDGIKAFLDDKISLYQFITWELVYIYAINDYILDFLALEDKSSITIGLMFKNLEFKNAHHQLLSRVSDSFLLIHCFYASHPGMEKEELKQAIRQKFLPRFQEIDRLWCQLPEEQSN
jgi:hypothetical protein